MASTDFARAGRAAKLGAWPGLDRGVGRHRQRGDTIGWLCLFAALAARGAMDQEKTAVISLALNYLNHKMAERRAALLPGEAGEVQTRSAAE